MITLILGETRFEREGRFREDLFWGFEFKTQANSSWASSGVLSL